MSETDLGGMGYGLAGARCAIHPEQLATRTCTRCGSFMCSTCAEGGAQTMCPTCLQRLGMGSRFPLNRENWNFSALWDYCFEIFKREWVMLSVATLIFFGVVFAVNFVTSIFSGIGGAAVKEPSFVIVTTIISTVLQQVVSGVMGLGLMRMIFDVLEGQKPDIGRMFSQFPKVGTYLLAMLVIVLAAGIPLAILGGIVAGIGAATGFDSGGWVVGAVAVGMLAFIPLIYFAIPLYLLTSEIAYNDDVSAMQAIRNCYAYGRNERLSILGVGIVAGLVTMAGALACCVGILPSTGLGYLLMGGLYLSLRNGANIQGEGEG